MKKPNTDEQLSALMDEELSEWQLRKLLQQSEDNPDILQRWAEFHEQEALRRGWPEVDVLEDVNAHLLQSTETTNQPRRSMFIGKISGMLAASAASVLVTVSALLFWPSSSPEPMHTVAASGSESLSVYWQAHAQYATYQAGQRWEEVDASGTGSH